MLVSSLLISGLFVIAPTAGITAECAAASTPVANPLSTILLAGAGLGLFLLGWAFGVKRERIHNLTSADV